MIGLTGIDSLVAFVSLGGGFVEKNPAKKLYGKGEKVTLTAHPDSGYKFDH